jgi:predicted transcriptional regulator of viral defense system
VVAGVAEPVKAAEVSVALGKGTLPGQVEAVRANLKRLAERGWLHRTPVGRYASRTDW